MNLVFVDINSRQNLLPLTYTKPTSQLRCGILSLEEKWKFYLHGEFSHLTADYLQDKYPIKLKDDNWVINPLAMPNKKLIEEIHHLDQGTALYKDKLLIAARISESELKAWQGGIEPTLELSELKPELNVIEFPWHLFQNNKEQIQHDYELLTKGRSSSTIHESTTLIGSQIFIEEGAKLPFCTLNASDGPIYIGKNSEIMEGSLIRGPFAICENSIVKMGAKIYGSTTIGPYCKVGGEVSNSVFFGYSNKGHDGFLGNSVIGEWCNLGADTNTSNLKNNYANVKLWNYESESFINTNLQFCGLVLGDHSKCGINTMFNTGTVVGVFANIFGSGFPRNFVPSFSWGGNKGFSTYLTKKAFEVASIVMERRGCEFSDKDAEILKEVFEISKKYRSSY